MNRIAIVGIHTGIGKTIASAVLTLALDADYWKPVQAGTDQTDSDLLRQFVPPARVHSEAFVLSQPLSPHAAAAIDGVTIDIKAISIPETKNLLLIETAGGLHSPMSDTATMADFVRYHKLPVILVTQHYLGSINHTLLTAEVLKLRCIPVIGLVLNGAPNQESEVFITRYSGLPILARIPELDLSDPTAITSCAEDLRPSLKVHFP